MTMNLILILALLITNGGNLVATAPVRIRSHSLLNSPLFNTPLSPPPVDLGAIFHGVIPLPQRHALEAVDLAGRSTDDESVNNTTWTPLSPVAVTTLSEPASVTLTSTPSYPFLSSTDVFVTTTVFVLAESSYKPSNATEPTGTVTVPLAVTTLTLEPSTVTVTALPLESSITSNKTTGRMSVQSITILETIPFTTTDLPAVTVTGWQTITSVVVVTVEETSTTAPAPVSTSSNLPLTQYG